MARGSLAALRRHVRHVRLRPALRGKAVILAFRRTPKHHLAAQGLFGRGLPAHQQPEPAAAEAADRGQDTVPGQIFAQAHDRGRGGPSGGQTAAGKEEEGFLACGAQAQLALAAAACLGYDAKGAWRIMRRDASKHPSPNGGYAEATVAGALGIRLGGHNRFFGKDTFREYMGDADHELEPQYIRKAMYLMYSVSLAAGVITALLHLGLYGLWS
mgnify:CR=1 FL=1